ncbi:Dynein associated protein [Popillia japonica]|uniref:Dynein associated protein n=1 Tax=Popillia japonica TaxID=7064 RepID=A0AAW1K3V9_POPJA
MVRDHTYFQCDENYGMFVRPGQVALLDESGKRIEVKDDGSKLRSTRQSTPGTKPKPTAVRRKTSPQKRPPSLSASSSRMSLTSSRQSLAGSRTSLMGSRQSLSGSRSHLASPSVERPTETEMISQIPKRASFIETGFVETLKPQFTPGQALTSTPITSMEEKLSNLQLQQEVENRNQQIKDLSEKLETLKIKRQEDKERLKDYDKLKIQLEQLIEFKAKIMESQASLQRDIQKAKQEAKDAIEARETHAEEVADLADAVEMATVEKEMAEEKAETLQLELEVCKEKLEEVTLDLEILKAELQNRGGGGAGETSVSTYEMKQLEQQNLRLRETLVKMRDMSAHDKHEYQKLLKDMDQKKSEIAELGRTKEKLSARVEAMEQQISDLQEQVDAALGAEEMVVILGEQKLTLEEKVTKLEEEVAELEALQDMNDQLVESNAELELDLREELDMAHGATREALRERDAALETVADREGTINKFRELVHKLQEQSLDLQQRLEKETSKPITTLPEILDFKKMFTETKAHTKAIDLELRRMDVLQLQQHIKYLTSYMPDTFMNRGGDHDSVLILLLIPRFIHKTEILLGQIRDKFPSVDKVDRTAVIKGHAVEQYAFRCRLSYYIYALQTILHQFSHSLNTCKQESLLKVGATFPEMAAQEKIIDGFVELVKRDQLDENVPTEALEKCVGYFYTMHPVLFVVDGKQNHTQLLNDSTKTLLSACDGLQIDAIAMKNLIESRNTGDMELLSQYIITTIEQLQQQLKLVKRRIPPDTSVANLGLNKEVFENLYQCYGQAGKVLRMLQDVVKNAVQTLNSSGEAEKGISPDKIKDIAINASDKVYEQDDLGPIQSVKNSLSYILTQITQIAQFLQDNEYEIATAYRSEEKPTPPIHLRAQAVRKELEQTKTLTSKLENKESDIKELRKALKEKQEQLSEMTIRKELAEKKLGNVNKDYELTIEKLQRKLEEAQNNLKKKEKEFEDTLDHLQTDIDSLENEKTKMKEILKVYKKALPDGNQMNSVPSIGPSLPAVVKDSPLLLQEIDNLRKLFHVERNERLRLESNVLKEQLNKLVPLPSFKNGKDIVLESLFKEGAKLKKDILNTLAKPEFPPVYNAKRGNGMNAWIKHFSEEEDKMLNLKNRVDEFRSKVAEQVIKRKHGGYVEADFTIFPTVEMTKAFKEVDPIDIGVLQIPKKYLSKEDKPGTVNLELTMKNLQNLIEKISF